MCLINVNNFHLIKNKQCSLVLKVNVNYSPTVNVWKGKAEIHTEFFKMYKLLWNWKSFIDKSCM